MFAKVLRLFLRSVGVISMIALFLWQADLAVDKYEEKKTSLQEGLEDHGTLVYPSITFCAVNIWETYPGILEMLKSNQGLFIREVT